MKYKLEFQKPMTPGGGKGGDTAAGVTLKRETGQGTKSPVGATVRIGADVMREMGWQVGDRVQWAVDGVASILAVRRVPAKDAGYMLGKNGGAKAGKSARFRVSAPLFRALGGAPTDERLDCPWVAEDGLLIITLEQGWARG